MKYILGLLILIGGIMAYTDVGFSEYLTRNRIDTLQLNPLQTQSLSSNFAGENIGSEMEGQFVGSGVKANNITTGEMSFDRAKGGTLQLGGQDNANGIFSLVDENDIEKILMDKDGMTITDGKLTVKNANNQSVLDSQGLISTNNFRSDRVFLTANFTHNNGVYTTVTGLYFNLSFTRTTKVLLMTNLLGSNDGFLTGNSQGAAVHINSSRISPNIPVNGQDLNGAVVNIMASFSIIYTFGPGSYYVDVKAREVGTGTGTIAADSDFMYIILGN